jgi:hypothetical protein
MQVSAPHVPSAFTEGDATFSHRQRGQTNAEPSTYSAPDLMLYYRDFDFQPTNDGHGVESGRTLVELASARYSC